MQSASYQNGSDGSSWYTASSRANMLREVMHRMQDRAFRQVQQEYPALADAMRGDKANRLDVKVGRAPRNTIDKLLEFGK